MAKMSNKKTRFTVQTKPHNTIKKQIHIYDTYSDIKHLYNLYYYALYLRMYKYCM